jgi:hypothetical protein
MRLFLGIGEQLASIRGMAASQGLILPIVLANIRTMTACPKAIQ